jgi:hypothetical protein
MANTTKILNTNATPEQIDTVIPPIIRNLVRANKEFVKTGFGPVSANSFPLYAGRFVDPLTGRIRTLPTPSSKYINPRNLQDVVRYYEARVLSGWNTFVRAQQNLYNLYTNMRTGKYT